MEPVDDAEDPACLEPGHICDGCQKLSMSRRKYGPGGGIDRRSSGVDSVA